MSIRWRKTGELLCAAMSRAEVDDSYIDDRLHYQLAVIEKILIADPEHKMNGLWTWKTKDINIERLSTL